MDTQTRKRKVIQLLIIVGIIVAVAALVWFAFGNTIPELFRLLRHGDRAEIRQYLASRSQWKGIICTMLLAILQVVSIVFPGLAIQVAAGVIYGWWRAFFICYIGFLIGNIGVFIAVRMLGNRISAIAGKQTAKGRKNRFFQKLQTLNPSLMVAMAYLLPLVPNGIIPYIAANTKIRLKNFTISLALTSWFQIFFNCLAGNFFIHGHYLLTVLMFLIQGGVFLIVAWKSGLFRKSVPAAAPAPADGAISENVEEQEDDCERSAANQ